MRSFVSLARVLVLVLGTAGVTGCGSSSTGPAASPSPLPVFDSGEQTVRAGVDELGRRLQAFVEQPIPGPSGHWNPFWDAIVAPGYAPVWSQAGPLAYPDPNPAGVNHYLAHPSALDAAVAAWTDPARPAEAAQVRERLTDFQAALVALDRIVRPRPSSLQPVALDLEVVLVTYEALRASIGGSVEVTASPAWLAAGDPPPPPPPAAPVRRAAAAPAVVTARSKASSDDPFADLALSGGPSR